MSSGALIGRTILLVNVGTPKKRFIVKKMQEELGLRIVALHTKREQWAELFVDHWILVGEGKEDADSIEAVRSFLNTHPEVPIEGAITFWEKEIALLAQIHAAFGWIGNSVQTALHTRSKYAMQDALRQAGRPAIPQAFLRTQQDLERAIEEVGLPAVMKPLFGLDSLFVVYSTNADEARAKFAYLLENASIDGKGYDSIKKCDTGEFVYQKYVPGTEFSVECYVQNGEPHVLGMHEKMAMQLPYFVETGDVAPPRISAAEKEALAEESRQSIKALGMTNSLAHVEIKLAPYGPQVIEIGARMGGDMIYISTKEVYGFDLIRAGCEIALGTLVTQQPEQSGDFFFNFYIIPERSGTIVSFNGPEVAAGRPEVVDFFFSRKAGDTISVPPDGFDTMGWIFVRGKSHEDAIAKMKKICANIRYDIH